MIITRAEIMKTWTIFSHCKESERGTTPEFVWCLDIVCEDGKKMEFSRYRLLAELNAQIDKFEKRQDTLIERVEIKGHFTLASAPESTEGFKERAEMDKRMGLWLERQSRDESDGSEDWKKK